MNTRVVIFEDNVKFLDALSILVDESPGLELTGAYLNTRDLPELLKNNVPDIVLMDIGILPINGIVATRLILQHFPSVKILIQTVFEDDQKVFAAICSGASGYVLKSSLPQSLLASITDLINGGSPMSPSVARKIMAFFRTHNAHLAAMDENYNLSKREKEVLRYLVEGSSYKMIAEKCEISLQTVKTHIKKIYVKLHVASMTEAVAKAIHENLI